MKKLVRFVLISTLLVAYFPTAQASATPMLPNDTWLYGAAGYARAVKLQQELNVPLVVYFYTDRCPYCRTLDSQYLPFGPVQDYLRGVVKVRIDAEQGLAERALAKRFGASSFPSFFVMRDSSARPVNVHPFRRVGNLTPTQFANACQAIAPVLRKTPGVRSPGTSGKFSERQADLLTVETTTSRVAQIVPVVNTVPGPRKARKQ